MNDTSDSGGVTVNYDLRDRKIVLSGSCLLLLLLLLLHVIVIVVVHVFLSLLHFFYQRVGVGMDWRMEPDTRLAGGDSHPNYNFIASRARAWGDGGGGGGGGGGQKLLVLVLR